jgi:hypothetical protein
MIDYCKLYEYRAEMDEARRLAITVDYTVFFETAPNHIQGRPQVVVPLNV